MYFVVTQLCVYSFSLKQWTIWCLTMVRSSNSSNKQNDRVPNSKAGITNRATQSHTLPMHKSAHPQTCTHAPKKSTSKSCYTATVCFLPALFFLTVPSFGPFLLSSYNFHLPPFRVFAILAALTSLRHGLLSSALFSFRYCLHSFCHPSRKCAFA